MITLQRNGKRITYDGSIWRGVDQELDPDLVELLDEIALDAPVSGDDPHPALARAQFVVDQIGGEIVDAGEPPAGQAERIY